MVAWLDLYWCCTESALELASAGILRLAVSVARPARVFPLRDVAIATTSCQSACAARVHAIRSMKQRGIASFFGAAKAENAPPTAKVGSATAAKSAKTASHHETAEVLKDVNSAGTKRAREVIRAWYIDECQGAAALHHVSSTRRCLTWYCSALCTGHSAKHNSSASRTGKEKQVEAYT